MAARGILLPQFHLGIRTTWAHPFVFLSKVSLRKSSRSGSMSCRYFCSQSPVLPVTMDMSDNRNKFAKRMEMVGLKPHHRIAIAVSGGPDSVALCVLTAEWKTENCDAATYGRSKSIDGLLAIVVDHGLRTESTEEANLVSHRIIDMGVKCEVAQCEWFDGKPQLGHLQEAARNKRYEILQNICVKQQIGVLLVAHHSDDQAELFILRLSRNSGVLGLAGMAFSSQIFPNLPNFGGEGSKAHGILLVRPLLEFSKEDMYNICQFGNQQWVEDPTNKSQLYARNRIRLSLNKLSSSTFKTELQAVISACRRTRLHVDQYCYQLLNHVVTIMHHGYTVIDLEILHPTELEDIFLAKFVTLVLQFVSQRHKPVRGNALKLLLNYLRTFPCKTCLTVASCYLCPAPGSKGTKVLVCCSIQPSLPLKMELFRPYSNGGQNCFFTNELHNIITDSRSYLNKAVPDASNTPFLDITSSESILTEAKRIGLLSDTTYKSIVSLQKEESELFRSNAEIISNPESNDAISSETQSKLIYPGQVGYFMDRFVLNWEPFNAVFHNISSEQEGKYFCACIIGDEVVAEVRHMVDADWIYLSDLSRKINEENSKPKYHSPGQNAQVEGKTRLCLDHAVLSAQRALVSLKSIPLAARRSLPVMVNAKGILLSIPGVGFTRCPKLMISAEFKPRIPLDGGHSSFL